MLSDDDTALIAASDTFFWARPMPNGAATPAIARARRIRSCEHPEHAVVAGLSGKQHVQQPSATSPSMTPRGITVRRLQCRGSTVQLSGIAAVEWGTPPATSNAGATGKWRCALRSPDHHALWSESGSRADSGWGTAPSFHAANAAWIHSIELGNTIVT
jgi:hypothetical protein